MEKLLLGCRGKSLPLIKLLLMDVRVNGLFFFFLCVGSLTNSEDGELDWQSNGILLSAFNEMELDQTLG